VQNRKPARSGRAILASAHSYNPCAANPSVTPRDAVHCGDMPPHPTGARITVDPAIDELNRIVDQAENLLRSLADEGGEAAEAVRDRVTQTLHQAKAKLAATAGDAEQVVESLAERTDDYVRSNPWQAVAIAALLGGMVTLLISKSVRSK
jgi:ElaB/YqjD/DUF883 family membrane-anchored ribosome-binding protein